MPKKIAKDQVVLPSPCGSFHAFMRKNFCVSEVRRKIELNAFRERRQKGKGTIRGKGGYTPTIET